MKAPSSIKFLCSYGGKIVPRHTDGLLRYSGGHTRFLAVDRSISFSELMAKLVDFCGSAVVLRCQLPDGDLETLVTVKSDEDLANIIEEYDRASRPLAVRAVLSPSVRRASPSSSVDSDHSPRRFPCSGGFCSPEKYLTKVSPAQSGGGYIGGRCYSPLKLPYYPFAAGPVEVKSRFSHRLH